MNIFSGALVMAIQVVATVVLGRLLSPRDFGLVAMVTTFSLLLNNATANGFIDSVLQRKEITRQLASNLFWINLAIAVGLSLAFIAAAPLLAKFYSEPSVAIVAVAMSASILIGVAPVMHATLLRRAMRFPALARNDIIARAVSVLVSIAFGIAGWKFWALVMGQIALVFSLAVGVLVLCPWIPSLPRRSAGTRSTLEFAGHITLRYGINYFVRNFDNILVGWRFGANPLGYYKKAYDLFAVSMTQLVSNNANVAVSALSRVRDDREQYVRYVLGAIGMLAFIGMGLAGDLTLIGKDVIRVLMGPKWGEAGWIFTFFAPAIGVMMVNGTHGWIHVSLGHADRWVRWGIIEWIVTCSLFLAGLHWGPQGIAVAWSVSFWILTLPAMWYAGRPIGFGVGPVLRVTWRYTAAALAAGMAAWWVLAHSHFLSQAAGAGGAMLRIACMTALFGTMYAGVVVILHGGAAPLRTMAKLILELRGRKPDSASAAIAPPAEADTRP